MARARGREVPVGCLVDVHRGWVPYHVSMREGWVLAWWG